MHKHWVTWLVASVALWTPITAYAQGRLTPEVVNEPLDVPQPQEPKKPVYSPAGRMTGVSFIDSAIPLSQMRTRIQGNYNNRQPTRGEYIWSKQRFLGGPGPLFPETNLDRQELSTIVEWAWTERISTFIETPVLWSNPDVNNNETGFGNINLGAKWAFWMNEKWTTAVQFRAYAPTATGRTLGNDLFSLEPALLANWRIVDFITAEAEVRYWLPLGGTDFAGDMLQYGVGLVFGQKTGNEINVMPVVEIVGWTLLDGQSLEAVGPGMFTISDASGQTILNLSAGLRLNFGNRGDIYVGYGHALTGDRWFESLWRFEMRILF